MNKTAKQKEAIQKIKAHTNILLEGGSRSGKTFIALFAVLYRASKVPNSRHLIVRYRFAHARMSICQQTMPSLLEATGMKNGLSLSKSDWTYTLANGSRIWVDGLDDKERTEKILGNEFDTIFINEGSQISYDSYEILKTRLNPLKTIRGKMIIDYNPPSVHHWGYKIFHQRKFPDGRPVPENDYVVVKMNPEDNRDNLSEQYYEVLQGLSGNKRKRFLEGNYSDDTGSLWKRHWIQYDNRDRQFVRIVVGVDPTGTKTGDEVGIIVAGKTEEEKFYILDDYSLHGTPKEWADEAVKAYDKWSADLIVAEKNYGGEMVEHTMRSVRSNLNIKLVTATRGKIVRAEPISALYEKGQVFHRQEFPDLEDEYCMYDETVAQSPNRLDASVWALSELSSARKGAFIGKV